MRRSPLIALSLILFARLAFAVTPTPSPSPIQPGSHPVKVDSNGNVITEEIATTAGNPSGVVKFELGGLTVDGVNVVGGAGGGPVLNGITDINGDSGGQLTMNSPGVDGDIFLKSGATSSFYGLDLQFGCDPDECTGETGGTDIFFKRFHTVFFGQEWLNNHFYISPSNATIWLAKYEGGANWIYNDSYSNSIASRWTMRRARASAGMDSSLSPVQTGDDLGGFNFYGLSNSPANYATSTWGQGASINGEAGQNFATNIFGTDLVFKNTLNNASSPSEAMRLDSDGSISFSRTTLALPDTANVKPSSGGSFSLGTTSSVSTGIGYLKIKEDDYPTIASARTGNGAKLNADRLTANRTVDFPDRSGLIGISDFEVKSIDFNAIIGGKYTVDTSSAEVIGTLPASPAAGRTIQFDDAKGTWGTNNFTVARNGSKINGGTSDYVGGSAGQRLTASYIDSSYGWSVGPAATGGGSGDVATDDIWSLSGDLAVGTGNNTATAVHVGIDGDILIADSGSDGGMRWVSPENAGLAALDSDDNVAVNSVSENVEVHSSTATVTLTASSRPCHVFIGAGGATLVNLPVTTSMPIGKKFWILNRFTSGNISVRYSTGASFILVAPETTAKVFVSDNTLSPPGGWDSVYLGTKVNNGKKLTVTNTLTLTGTDGTTLSWLTGGTLGTAAYTNANAYEVPLTFSGGLTRSVNNVTPSGVLADLAGISFSQGDVIYHNGTNLVALPAGTPGQLLSTGGPSGTPSWVTASGTGDMLASNNLSDLASKSTARTNLGVAIGTNVQAYDPDLTTWAGITPDSNIGTFLATPTSANFALAVTDALSPGGGSKVILSPGSLNVDSGKTLNVKNTMTLVGQDGRTYTFPSASATLATITGPNTFAGAQTITSGTITGLSTLGLQDGASAFDLRLVSTSQPTHTANRTLTLDVANRDIYFRVANSIALESDDVGVRTLNIGEGGTLAGAAYHDTSDFLQTANNLSELAGSAADARDNINAQEHTSNLDTWSSLTPATGVEDFITSGVLAASRGGSGIGGSQIVSTPIILAAMNVSTVTTGSPTDIATIDVPPEVGRFRVIGVTADSATSFAIQENVGISPPVDYEAWDDEGGSGNQLLATTTLPGPWPSNDSTLYTTSDKIVIRQLTDSAATSDVISFYVYITPLPGP